MESHEVIKEALSKTSPKAVASDLGVSLSLVYKWAQPNTELGSGSRNPLDRIHELMKLTGEEKIIHWLCKQAGGHYVRNPDDQINDYEYAPATNEIVHQFAELLQVITRAAADNTITPDESDRIRQVWDELKMITEGFVKACEERRFERIPTPGGHHHHG
tara:strand:- start:58 stop:537 length:480 start_codon:yes stop_codon:yes gene_type:complete